VLRNREIWLLMPIRTVMHNFKMPSEIESNDSEVPQSPPISTATEDCSTKIDEKFGVIHTDSSPTIQEEIAIKKRCWRPFFSGIKPQSVLSHLRRFGRTQSAANDVEQGRTASNPGMPDDFFQSRR
jgi:hypothetical protein